MFSSITALGWIVEIHRVSVNLSSVAVIYSSQDLDCHTQFYEKLLSVGCFVLCGITLLTSVHCVLALSREFKSRQINPSII